MRNIIASILLLCGLSAFAQPTTNITQSVTFAWTNTVPNQITNYTVWRGTNTGVYFQSNSVGTNLTYTWTGLTAGQTSYFAATATDVNGLTSAYSTEAVSTIPQPPPPPQSFHVTVTIDISQP